MRVILPSLTALCPSYADDPRDLLALAPEREHHGKLEAADASDGEPSFFALPRRVAAIVLAAKTSTPSRKS
jgi:hypothetical protein